MIYEQVEMVKGNYLARYLFVIILLFITFPFAPTQAETKKLSSEENFVTAFETG